MLTLALALGACVSAWADGNEAERSSCAGLPTQAQLKAALTHARKASNAGFNLDMWGSVVNRDGGLALYNPSKQLVGAVGVSGDSSCADTPSRGAFAAPCFSTMCRPGWALDELIS